MHVPTKCAEPKHSKKCEAVTSVTHSRGLDAVNRVARCKVVEGVRVCVGPGTHLSFKWRSAPASMRMPHTTECPSHAATCKGVLQERTRRHSDGGQSSITSTTICRLLQKWIHGGGRGGEGMHLPLVVVHPTNGCAFPKEGCNLEQVKQERKQQRAFAGLKWW